MKILLQNALDDIFNDVFLGETIPENSVSYIFQIVLIYLQITFQINHIW
jgi:hypothetical protein